MVVMPGAYTAACVQLEIGNDAAANLAKCRAWIDRAAAGGARLIVLPELCNVVGPFASPAAAWDAAAAVPGPYFDALVERAGAHGVFLAFNILARGSPPDTYITTYLVDPAGAEV